MSSKLPEVFDRLDLALQPIGLAIESKNFKHALKLVDKRLSKKPSEQVLQALRCYIQSQYPVQRQAAGAFIRNLVLNQAALTDLDALALYDEAAAALDPQISRPEPNQYAGKLRLLAVKGKQKDEKFCKACLKSCLSRDDLLSAQLIAAIMETSFPENRKYSFWSITIMAHFARSPSCPDTQRVMHKRLAYKKIQKLAGATIETTNETAAPPRSIQTPQELKLLHAIVKAEGGTAEYLELLKSPILGTHSKAAKGEWDFIRAHVLALRDSHMWQDLLNMCDGLLAKAHVNEAGIVEDARGADMLVWESYILAAESLHDQEILQRAHTMVVKHCSPEFGLDKTYLHNAHLAELCFLMKTHWPKYTKTIRDTADFKIENVPDAVCAIYTYLHRYAENSFAYEDVKALIETLQVAEQSLFLKILKILGTDTAFLLCGNDSDVAEVTPFEKRKYDTKDSITARVTISKIAYLIDISLPEPTMLLKFRFQFLSEAVAQFLSHYKASIEDQTLAGLLPTDTHPADDFYVLAAMCLLKLAGDSRPLQNHVGDMNRPVDVPYVLQATALLEYALSRSKVNPQIMLLLVRLYSFLGAGSLAMRVFEKLRIKQIQFDTLGYIIFDRISSLHPYRFVQFDHEPSELHDPSFLLEIQKFYRKSQQDVVKNMWTSLEKSNYDQFSGFARVQDRLSRSTGAVMSVLELRRVNRITRKEAALSQVSYGYDILPRKPELITNWHDNSDYLTFPNFESDISKRFEEYIRIGPPPSSLRCRAFLLIEKLLMITASASQGLMTRAEVQAETETAASAIQPLEAELKKLDKRALTTSEEKMVEVHFALFKLLHAATIQKKAPTEEEEKIGSSLTAVIHASLSLQTKRVSSVPSTLPPLFVSHLHPLFTSYELASNVLTISSFNPSLLPANAKPFSEKITEAATLLKKAVAEKAAALRKTTLAEGGLNYIIEGVNKLKGPVAFDHEWLEEWGADLVESWEESIAGLVNCAT